MAGMPWFTTKGQICQLLVTLAALCLAGYNAWPDMKMSDYLSGGAVLFYILVALVLGSIVHLIVVVRRGRRPALNHDAAVSKGSPFELKFSPHPPYRVEDRQYTCYRVGVHNTSESQPIHNVRMVLLSMDPTPSAYNFQKDFPRPIRPPGESADAIPILNPGQEERIQILRCWINSDQKLVVDGCGQADFFYVEQGEFWQVKLLVSTANAGNGEIELTVRSPKVPICVSAD